MHINAIIIFEVMKNQWWLETIWKDTNQVGLLPTLSISACLSEERKRLTKFHKATSNSLDNNVQGFSPLLCRLLLSPEAEGQQTSKQWSWSFEKNAVMTQWCPILQRSSSFSLFHITERTTTCNPRHLCLSHHKSSHPEQRSIWLIGKVSSGVWHK